MAQLDGLAPHQRQQLCRQVVAARHLRAFHEYRHHANAAGECRRGFDAHEIVGIVEATPTCAVGSEPVLADKNDHDFARAKRALDRIDKIDTRLDPLDVHENMVGTEVSGEPIVEPARITGRVVASVADEYAVHGFRARSYFCMRCGVVAKRLESLRDTRTLARGTPHASPVGD